MKIRNKILEKSKIRFSTFRFGSEHDDNGIASNDHPDRSVDHSIRRINRDKRVGGPLICNCRLDSNCERRKKREGKKLIGLRETYRDVHTQEHTYNIYIYKKKEE